ncbi:MAG: tRNA pseudouridine(38-40) synthase TruA [Rhodospirillales bacterium]
MERFKLTLEYNGAAFHGWQRQANGISVQEAVEEAIRAFTGEDVTLAVAGRTDAGVHALGQVAHADIARPLKPYKVRDAINFHVRPHPVCVVEAEAVGEAFHARFGAKRRAYLYRILNRRAPAILDAGKVWHVPRPLDAAAMDRAAKALLGHHDFTSFRAAGCQADSALRTLDRLDVRRAGDEIHVETEARSFLYHQVRNMVGSLLQVGLGRWPESRMGRILAARDRAQAGETAPPEGLYFTRVDYDAVE